MCCLRQHGQNAFAQSEWNSLDFGFRIQMSIIKLKFLSANGFLEMKYFLKSHCRSLKNVEMVDISKQFDMC